MRRHPDHALLFMLFLASTPVVGALVNACVYPLWAPRYTLYSMYGLILCMVVGAQALGGLGGGRGLQWLRRRAVPALLLGGVVLLFATNWLSFSPPFNFDYKSAAKLVTDNEPIYVFPGNEAPCIARLRPSNKVEPWCVTKPVPGGNWIIVHKFLGIHLPRADEPLIENAVRVGKVTNVNYTMGVWRTLPKGRP